MKMLMVNRGDRVRIDHPDLTEPAHGTVAGCSWGNDSTNLIRLDGTGQLMNVPEEWTTVTERWPNSSEQVRSNHGAR